MAKQNVWTVLAENAVSKKPVNYNITEMNDTEAALAISEAMYEAGVAVHAGNDINDAILEFAMQADAKGYNAMTYITEAFNFGGFFKKIYDFLIKMWGTIVNYFKALIGNKFGASGNIVKIAMKIAENLMILEHKKFDSDAEVTFKKYDKIQDAARVAGLITSPTLYLKTPLVEGQISQFWTEFGKSTTTTDAKGFNIVTITQAAAGLADTVQLLKNLKASGDGIKDNKTDVEAMTKGIEGGLTDIKAFNNKLSLGEKGAVESFCLLLDKVKTTADIKKIVEDSKLKDSKNLTELIRKLLSYFFPADAGTDLVSGSAALEARVAILINSIKSPEGDDTIEGFKRSDTATAKLVDPIKASLKICEDILGELKKAATIISNFDKGDMAVVDEKDPKKAAEDQGASSSLATKMTEFGKELSTTSTNMQQVVLKGMDAGAVLLETVFKEILAQTELLMKAPADKVTRASVKDM